MRWVRIGIAVAARPRLWPAAVRQIRRLGLPPDRAYLAFRLVTQYGDPGHAPTAADVVSYLAWCQQMRRLT